jgi:hypothetical protein
MGYGGKMDKGFKDLVEFLEPSFCRLVSMPPAKVDSLLKGIPEKGIYLFSEGPLHFYVGRSDRLRKRILEHGRPGASHNTAPFAYRLTRKVMLIEKASYKPEGSRNDLMTRPEFQRAFLDAKERIRRMDVRWVEEGDPVRQALLEIYVSVVLKTPENEFITH